MRLHINEGMNGFVFLGRLRRSSLRIDIMSRKTWREGIMQFRQERRLLSYPSPEQMRIMQFRQETLGRLLSYPSPEQIDHSHLSLVSASRQC
jgi:hypothetical protein